MTKNLPLACIGALFVFALGVAACDDGPIPDDDVVRPTVPTDGLVPGEIYEVEVNGMPCIIWINHYDSSGHGQDSTSGISCDWSMR